MGKCMCVYILGKFCVRIWLFIFKYNGVQSLFTLKIDWCFGLIINSYYQERML